MKNIIKSVCVIIGAIIGAGFASGREIYIFFNIYGTKGFIGMIVSSMLTGIIIYKVLRCIRDKNIINYEQYLEELKLNKTIKQSINIIINIFLLISFYIMIAGFCAYFKQEFNISKILIGIIISTICYITFMNNIEGVTKISTILIPFLIIMIIVVGIKSNIFSIEQIVHETKLESNWIISSLEYASYNSILLIPILIGLKKYTYKKEKKIAITVSIIFIILSTILYAILITGGKEISNLEMPLIYTVRQFGNIYSYLYGFVIISAIYTSAVAAGYGFIENYSKNKKMYKRISLAICISAVPISYIGFSSLVDTLYPIFGLLGLIQVIYIMTKNI